MNSAEKRASTLGQRLSLAVASLGCAGVLMWWSSCIQADLATPRDLSTVEHAGASSCLHCHEDHHASWGRTFHRTMTQEASPEAVLAPFAEGPTLEYGDVRAQLREEAGRYFVLFDGWEIEGQSRFEVVRTVGSRRYQQYLSPGPGGRLLRLPIAWHIEEQLLFHMNGAFLTEDPSALDEGTQVSAGDYARHLATWNDNCVFCHNVAPNPGRQTDGSFETTTAELGIACEACHGPGEAHIAANSDPMRRQWLHHSEVADPTIINPARLDAARSSDICGRCHGQRLTDDIGEVLRDGDRFLPGDLLSEHSEPLWRDTTLNGQEGIFAPRFWSDGSPRLTAYEYQGYLQSRCVVDTTFACTTCHGMHEGDPRGQIRPSAEGNAGCVSCHTDIADEHSRHQAGGGGDQCVDCHMPRTVYGVLDAHRNHRIDNPNPRAASLGERPDACTSCHVDASQQWAVEELERLWAIDLGPPSAPSEDAAANRRRLFGGDPIERAVAADAIGRSTFIGTSEAMARRGGDLLEVIASDTYPAVRRIAARAFRRWCQQQDLTLPESLRRFDVMLPSNRRLDYIREVQAALPAGSVVRPSRGELETWRARARHVAIEIGE